VGEGDFVVLRFICFLYLGGWGFLCWGCGVFLFFFL